MSQNDNYYQPADDRMWDAFVDDCDERGLDPAEEDYDAWVEEQYDRAEDALISAAEYARENDYED